MNIITVKNLKKEFSSYERGEGFLEAVKAMVVRKKVISKAVNSINLSIKKGEIVGFLGPNGAGKSTTIKMLSGIMYPDGGHVDVMGYVPWKDRKNYVRNIGVVFGQKSQLFWDLPPVDAFHMHKGVFSLADKPFKKQLDMLVKMLSIQNVMKRPTRLLSLGERMRCEFVMAMLHQPKVVFLDEPAIGLDIFAKETIRKFIRSINKKEGTTFIVTSHDLEDIEHLCDRVIVINHGKIVFDDVVEKLATENKKIITIKLYDKINFTRLGKLKGIKVLKKISPYAVTVQVDVSKTALEKVIKRIHLSKPIEDLEVTNPPITEIIKKLYKRKRMKR